MNTKINRRDSLVNGPEDSTRSSSQSSNRKCEYSRLLDDPFVAMLLNYPRQLGVPTNTTPDVRHTSQSPQSPQSPLLPPFGYQAGPPMDITPVSRLTPPPRLWQTTQPPSTPIAAPRSSSSIRITPPPRPWQTTQPPSTPIAAPRSSSSIRNPPARGPQRSTASWTLPLEPVSPTLRLGSTETPPRHPLFDNADSPPAHQTSSHQHSTARWTLPLEPVSPTLRPRSTETRPRHPLFDNADSPPPYQTRSHQHSTASWTLPLEPVSPTLRLGSAETPPPHPLFDPLFDNADSPPPHQTTSHQPSSNTNRQYTFVVVSQEIMEEVCQKVTGGRMNYSAMDLSNAIDEAGIRCTTDGNPRG
ncbi:unnamed protein product [Zymoseptoria tritici ST99CH_1A5]|uniref:Uncharacterized protein n=3 Tax=Zymoseptoria tritici TaxID=1047171 RepID=A0A1X7SAB7_ZYMT9|nr:unnamed protein product [Zymoseptoria tritici ST99CH_3D7]SMR62645.1 unnamed protein product [Zymoseptoria tritici ST99CH_1E4]SMY30562.1 unnamed protein product [Zymoseptoria tritici ST99CH_1A5]